MKKITTLLFLFLVASIASAQQLPMYSQYYQSPFLYNPANTGISGFTNVYLINHTQWVSMPGSPITRAVAADGTILKDKAGLGLVLYSDVTDITSRIGAMATYAYHLKTSENTKLSFGLGLGVLDNRIDYSKIIVKDANDLSLFNSSQSKTTFDGNAGINFNWKKLDIGFSVPHLFASKINYSNNYIHSNYTLARHYLANIKYNFDISKTLNLRCMPLVMLRYMPQAPIQYDVNLIFDWKDMAGIGVAYKSNYAVTPSAYIKIHSSFTIGYAYDFIISNISNYAGTSHELFLSYRFGTNKKKELEEMQTNIDDMKKKVEDGSTQLNKTNARVDSIERELTKIKTEIEANKQKTEQLENELKNSVPKSNNDASKANDANNNSSKDAGRRSGATKNENIDINENEKTGLSKKENSDMDAPQKIGAVDADGVRTANTNDFNDPKGNKIKPGYYLVVGTFFYNDYALAEIDRFKTKGFKKTTYIFYKPLQYHYLYTGLLSSKEEANKLIQELRTNVQSDAWILRVVE